MGTREILDSWKAISDYIGRTSRTCHRWEAELNLPIRRLDGSSKSRVFAYKDEIDRWLDKKLHEDEGFWRRILPQSRRWAVSIAFATFVVIAVLGWRTLNNAPTPPVFSGRPAVAVLPFANNTGDPGLGYLGESLPVHLIEGMQRSAEHLTVFSPQVITESFIKLGLDSGRELNSDELYEVARRTGADFLVQGQVGFAHNRLRVSYKVKDAATLQTVGSDRESGSERNLPMLRNQLTASVLGVFGIPMGQTPESTLPCSPQANRLYEMARAAERKYTVSLAPADLDIMTDLLRKALEAEPTCALVLHGLGDAFQFHFVYGGHDPAMLEAAFDNYRKAHDLAPKLAEANLGLGWVHFFQKDNAKAYLYFKQALELDPANVRVLTDIGAFLKSVGVLERSAEYFSRVIRAGDTSSTLYELRGWAYEHMGLYEGALADYERIVKLEPTDWRSRCRRARILILMKRFDEAEEDLRIAETLSQGERHVKLGLALIHAARGERKEALTAIAPFLGRPARYTYYITRVYAALGMIDEAVAAIGTAIEKGFDDVHDYVFFFPVLNNTRDYFFDSVRGDKRFAEILRREEHKHLANLEKFVGL